ncbi:hypothetical protein [Myxococcus phage Mx1]|nr:hypothetical protein [Myxococcus phage Mx1]
MITNTGCEIRVFGQRKQILELAVAYFEFVGARDIKARMDGYTPPTVINGTLADFRPDMTLTQGIGIGGTAAFVEVVTDPNDKALESRLSLINSARKLYKGDLYFFVPEGETTTKLKSLLSRWGIYARVFPV